MPTTVTAAMANVLEQRLTPTVEKCLWNESPFFKRILPDRDGVIRDENVGQGWLKRCSFAYPVAGAVDNVPLDYSNYTRDTTDTGFTVNVNKLPGTPWQSPDQTVSPGYHQYAVKLKNSAPVMYIPHELLRLAELGANIGQQYNDHIEGFARNIARHRINSFYLQQEAGTGGTDKPLVGILCTFTQTTATELASLAVSSVNTVVGGSIRRLYDGQRVTVWEKHGTSGWEVAGKASTLGGIATFMVVQVDPLAGTFKLVNLSSSATDSGVLAATAGTVMYLVAAGVYPVDTVTTAAQNTVLYSTAWAANCTPNLFTGIERMLVSSGTIWGSDVDGTGGIDIAVHKWFRSYLPPNYGGSPLDRSELLRTCMMIVNSGNPAGDANMVLTTPGVAAAYADQLSDLMTYEVNGRPMDLNNEGYDNQDDGTFMKFRYGGRTWSVVTDPWVNAGTAYFLKGNNNFRLLAPPRIPKAGSNQYFDAACEFLAPTMGSNSIFMPVYSSGRLTPMLMCPVYSPFEFHAKNFCGAKLTGLGEDKGVSA